LLIGQRAFWESDRLYLLEGLSLAEVAAWLDAHSIVTTEEDRARLYRYTGGNPRLIQLCGALYEANHKEVFTAVLDQLPQSQALLPLWRRLERRLPGAERRLMHALSVFRSPAPADAWLGGAAESADALAQLCQRGLVRQDEQGGLFLLPALREIVYADLEVELQEEYHLRAAQIRAERGEYTAAVHHLQRADQPEAAVALWFPQRAGEIARGQAGAALAIFAQISQRRLNPQRRKELLLLRSELNELAGAPERVIDELAQTEWPLNEPATPEAMSRLGQALEAQGQAEAALETYQAGLEAVAALLRQGGHLHVQRSLTQLRQREMQQAWREANLARFHAETMLGVVYDQRGDYATAHAHYTIALAIAEETVYLAGIAQTHHYLAMLAGRQLEMVRALTHFEQAIAFYEHVGDRVNRELVRGNLASAYIQSRRFQDALAPAELALHFFRTMGNPFRTAQNASNLAEAHAELGNLAQAQLYAELVLQQEEPHSHPYALYTLGTVYLRRGDWSQAEAYYEQSRKVAEQNDDAYLQAFAWRALGEVHSEAGRTAQATAAFAQSLDLFQYLNIAEEARQTEQLLSQCDAKHAKDEA
jgi:tetratricopeptide (TPR) repeat protein